MDDKELAAEIEATVETAAAHLWNLAADLLRRTRMGEEAGTFTGEDVPNWVSVEPEVRDGFARSVSQIMQQTTMAVGSIATLTAKEASDGK